MTVKVKICGVTRPEDARAAAIAGADYLGVNFWPGSPRAVDVERARAIGAAATKVELEDLYAPYKPRRRTRAQIAREAGLEPLADALLANPMLAPEAEAARFISAEKGVAELIAAQKAALA